MALRTIHLALSVVVTLQLAVANGQQPATTIPIAADWPRIAVQLEAMLDLDQSTRKILATLRRQTEGNQLRSEQQDVGTLRAKMSQDDATNLGQLKAIVSQHGWPHKSAVGSKAALGAWAVLQHADAQYQIEVAPLIRAAVRIGEADGASLALLEDRILVSQRLPQLYGSQVSSVGAYVSLFKVSDETKLDRRRAEVGLEPICTYLKRFLAVGGEIMFAPCTTPVNFQK